MISKKILIWTGGFGLLFFIGIALNVVFGSAITAFDTDINQWLGGHRTPWLNELMLVFTSLGDALFLLFVATVIVITLFLSGARRTSGGALIAFLTMTLTVMGLKALTARPRPTIDLYPGVEAYSFPSGHVTNSAFIYGAIALLMIFSSAKGTRKRLGLFFGALPIAVASSRIYLGAHWPSDTIAGLALATAALCLFAAWLSRQPLKAAQSRALTKALVIITIAFPLYLLATLPDARALYTALHG